jgi:hypothetical protein
VSADRPNLNFPPNSRYHSTPCVRRRLGDGVERVWLAQRFPPDPATLASFEEHEVQGGERLDNIAAGRLGDPEQYWRLCDANRALRPDELTETPGRRLRIPLPEGMSGGSIV